MTVMKAQQPRKAVSTLPGIDEVFEKKLEELVIVLSAGQGAKNQVYDERRHHLEELGRGEPGDRIVGPQVGMRPAIGCAHA